MENKYNAVVAGAGSIGALKPDEFDSPKSKNILTLAHAFHNHPKINLVGIVDVDFEKAMLAGDKWGTIAYEDIKFIPQNIDIVTVAIPTERHLSYCLNLPEELGYDPKILIIEKPATNFIEHAELIQEKYKNKNTQILVDYIRRYEPIHCMIREELKNGSFGNILSCRILYTRGLMHEGCHAIDFCNNFFGEYQTGLINGQPIIDFREEDPTYSGFMIYENCPNVVILPCDGRKYSIFDIEIVTDKAIIRFIDHGLRVRVFKSEPEKTYGNYPSMNYTPWDFPTELDAALYYLVNNAVEVLEKEKKPLCGIEDAIKVHKIYGYLRGEE